MLRCVILDNLGHPDYGYTLYLEFTVRNRIPIPLSDLKSP